MIEISDNIAVGDRVFVWFSPFKEKANKKPIETEYRIGTLKKDYLKLESPENGYSLAFNKELIETWFGNVRKAK